MPTWLVAGLWGGLAGSALVIGAAIGFATTISRRLIAAIMAFGGGVLISALAFDLMDGAYRRGGFDSTSMEWGGSGDRSSSVPAPSPVILTKGHPQRPAGVHFHRRNE